MRLKARIDRNQPEIVDGLRKLGYSVQSLAQIGKGCPDILVGADKKNFLFEVKDGDKVPSARKLTPDEERWHEEWGGQVHIINNLDEAIVILDILGVEPNGESS